jgi:hypothetical protein
MSIEQRIECQSGKLLARANQEGMKFWCARHHREEFFTWEQIDAVRRSFMEVPTRITISDHTTIIPTR